MNYIGIRKRPVETRMYYCKSRYYVPQWCRWLTADSIDYLDPASIVGLNLYAYCYNDPVNFVDPSGCFPWLILAAVLLFTPVGGTALQVATSALSYAGMAVASIFDKDIRNDMNSIGWNPFNNKEDIVLKSSKVSFYKGVPVFQISNMGGSMSLGAIFFDKSQGAEVLKHERGHNTQFMMMGLGNYFIQIGIPSIWKNGDQTPWELSASLLGGSALSQPFSSKQKKQAILYSVLSTYQLLI